MTDSLRKSPHTGCGDGMAAEGPHCSMRRPGETSVPASRPVHGGVRPADLRALGLKPEDVLDFSASISPVGPPPGTWEAMAAVDLSAYPDPECLELREALSRRLSGSADVSSPPKEPEAVPIERILIGNGSTELIHLLARAFLSPPRPGAANCALLFTPTYGEYLGACRLAGVPVINFDADHSPPFRWDLTEAVRRIEEERPGLVFLCNPNNPTGVYLDEGDVQVLAGAVAGYGGLLVLDEAYLSFVADPWDGLELVGLRTSPHARGRAGADAGGPRFQGNVVLLRSMTKDYALTALRLGYAVASEDVIAALEALQPDWSVNGLAQAAGLAALADAGYLDRSRAAVEQARDFLTGRLGELGFTVHPSSANYLLVDVSRDGPSAVSPAPRRVGDDVFSGGGAQWRDRLMRRGLFVRDCASFGLPSCIRIGIRPLADCQRLADAMGELAASG